MNGTKVLVIEVLERGFTSARTVSAADTVIPPGEVLVDIALEKRESPQHLGGRRCVPSDA